MYTYIPQITPTTHSQQKILSPITKPYGSFSVFLRTPDSKILILPTGQLQSDADWSGKTGWLFASTRWVLDPVINGVTVVQSYKWPKINGFAWGEKTLLIGYILNRNVQFRMLKYGAKGCFIFWRF